MNRETKTKYAEEERGRFGANVADVTADYAQIYNMPEGVCLTELQPGGAAEQAGLQQGDVLQKFDGTKVKTTAELRDALSYCTAGDTVEVVVQRNTNGEYKEQTVKITLQ
jgi:serine protease Do